MRATDATRGEPDARSRRGRPCDPAAAAGTSRVTALARDGARDLRTTCTREEFRRIAGALHAELFAAHQDSDVYVALLKCLLAKIHDERQTAPRAPYRFQVFRLGHGEETAEAVFARIDDLYADAHAAYVDPRREDSLDERTLGPEQVKSVVRALESMSLTAGAALHGDVMGAFFEEILRIGFKQDKGMYFTHANLVWFMLEALDLQGLCSQTWRRAARAEDRLPHVIDPACGSGAFLVRAMRLMTGVVDSCRRELVEEPASGVARAAPASGEAPCGQVSSFLHGCDPNFAMALTTMINVLLHGGDGAHVSRWDALGSLTEAPHPMLRPRPASARSQRGRGHAPAVSEQFDVVVSNPPFGVTLTAGTRRTVDQDFRLGASTPPEGLFIERYAQLLRPGGRLGVVVPESLLNGNGFQPVRLVLYRCFFLRAIVSLPRGLFVDTPILTSLLFAQKKTAEEIAAWDAGLDAAQRRIDAACAEARRALRRAGRCSTGTARDVAEAFLTAMDGLVDRQGALRHVKRGRMPFDVSRRVEDAGSAIEYYSALMGSSAFKAFCTRAVFAVVARARDYEFPVYAVDEVGFKLSRRGERVRPNQLMRLVDTVTAAEVPNLHLHDGGTEITVEAAEPPRVIDHLRREVRWT